MRQIIVGLSCLALLASVGGAAAQTSFSTPLLQPAAPVQEAAPPDAAQPRPKPKPKRNPNLPPASITVINASSGIASDITVGTEERMARLPKPLPPKARAVLKLPKLKGCIVSVRANLEGIGEVDTAEFNVCKEKFIRLVGT